MCVFDYIRVLVFFNFQAIDEKMQAIGHTGYVFSAPCKYDIIRMVIHVIEILTDRIITSCLQKPFNFRSCRSIVGVRKLERNLVLPVRKVKRD